jgi:hypothetical protein
MTNIDYDSRREQRNFGLVMAVAITALMGIRWAHRYWKFADGALPSVWWPAVAGAFLLLALLYPRALKPLFYVWMQFAFALNWLITRILLSFVFLAMLAPGHLILVLARKDPLKRRWEPDALTYWDDPEDQPREFDRYKDQF